MVKHLIPQLFSPQGTKLVALIKAHTQISNTHHVNVSISW